LKRIGSEPIPGKGLPGTIEHDEQDQSRAFSAAMLAKGLRPRGMQADISKPNHSSTVVNALRRWNEIAHKLTGRKTQMLRTTVVPDSCGTGWPG